MRKFIILVSLLLAGPAAAQDDKVFKKLAPADAEAMLKKFDIDFKKVDSKSPETFYYDFQRNKIAIRLYLFEGKDLMLDTVLPGMPIEKVNEWNIRAKFSRACLHRSPKGEYVTLESNLDLIGGATEGTVKQFVMTFDEEIRTFAKFVGESGESDQIFTGVTGDRLEGVFKALGIRYDRKPLNKGAGEFFDFEVDNRKLRLVNFGGKDLMLDAHFKKISLEDVNRYNLEKKFVRVVSYDVGGMAYSSLECNLDCEAGTSEGILRNFIVGFIDDVKNFTKFVESR